MQPIHRLIQQLRWDPRFAEADLRLGYHDRVLDRTVVVGIDHVELERGNRFSFRLVSDSAESIGVPFHRVRAVWCDDRQIWARPQRS